MMMMMMMSMIDDDDDDDDLSTHPPESHERQEVQNHQTSIYVCDYKLNVIYIKFYRGPRARQSCDYSTI